MVLCSVVRAPSPWISYNIRAAYDVHGYAYRSVTAVLPLPLTHALFAIIKFFVAIGLCPWNLLLIVKGSNVCDSPRFGGANTHGEKHFAVRELIKR